MKKPLFVIVIFDMQYTEIKYLMTIVHVLDTKQNAMHIWKVYTMVFCTIPHIANIDGMPMPEVLCIRKYRTRTVYGTVIWNLGIVGTPLSV